MITTPLQSRLRLPLVVALLFLFFTIFNLRPVKANPFEEAFGSIASFSRGYGHRYRYSRPRRSSRRRRAIRRRYSQRRRAYARRRSERAYYKRARRARSRRRNARIARARARHRQNRSARRVARIRRERANAQVRMRRQQIARAAQARSARLQSRRKIQLTRRLGRQQIQQRLVAQRQARARLDSKRLAAKKVASAKRLAAKRRAEKRVARVRAQKIQARPQKLAMIVPKYGRKPHKKIAPLQKRERKIVPKVKAHKPFALTGDQHIMEQVRGRVTSATPGEISALNRAEKRSVQKALHLAGFYRGEADGVFGFQTRRAIRSYQNSLDHARTGRLNNIQLASLLRATSVSEAERPSYLPKADQKLAQKRKIRKWAKSLSQGAVPSVKQVVAKSSYVPQKVSLLSLPLGKPALMRLHKPRKLPQKPRELQKPSGVMEHKDNARLPSQASLASKTQALKRSVLKILSFKKTRKFEGRKKLIQTWDKDKVAQLARPNRIKKRKKSVAPKPEKISLKVPTGSAKSVDYYHALGHTSQGESLWVVKCMDKRQLKLYFWRDAQWWVRGKNGGAVGMQAYGKDGIRKLAAKVCTL